MTTSAGNRDRVTTDDHDRRLREMNDALLVSSVHQQELTEQAERLTDALRLTEKQLRSSNEELERRVAERSASLTVYQQRLRGLVEELGRAGMRERKRVALELHDNLAQMLAVCKMKASAIEAAAPAGCPMAQEALAIKQLLGEGINYTRTLMSDLRPEILNEYDLSEAVRWVAKRMERYGLLVRVEDDSRPKPLEQELVELIFDCVRELLFNVIKHAATERAMISVRRTDHVVRVVVSDAGAGFDPGQTEASSQSRGFGLFSISERLGMLGGRMEVASARGHGAQVSLIVPLRFPSNHQVQLQCPKGKRQRTDMGEVAFSRIFKKTRKRNPR